MESTTVATTAATPAAVAVDAAPTKPCAKHPECCHKVVTVAAPPSSDEVVTKAVLQNVDTESVDALKTSIARLNIQAGLNLSAYITEMDEHKISKAKIEDLRKEVVKKDNEIAELKAKLAVIKGAL